MHPILVEIPTPWGALPIYSYGVMLGLSLIVAWYFVMFFGTKKEGLDKELMANCFIITAVAAILGARLLYVFTNLDRFDTIGEWFAFRSGGLVAYGGFLGGLVGSWAYMRHRRVPLLAWADVVAPTLMSGLALTRIGCWLYGCDFGRPLDDGAPGWLAKLGTFPKWDIDGTQFACDQGVSGSPAWSYHVRNHDLAHEASASLAVHPTQLYASVAGVVLFGIGLLVWKHRTFRGQVLFVLTMCYALWRFAIEYVRDDPERGFALGFSTSQLISLALVPVAVTGYVVVRKRAREHGETPIPASARAAADDTAEGEKDAASGKGAKSSSTMRKPPKKSKGRRK